MCVLQIEGLVNGWLRDIKGHGAGKDRAEWHLYEYKGNRKLTAKTADQLILDDAHQEKRQRRGPSDLDEDNHNVLERHQRKVELLRKPPYVSMQPMQVHCIHSPPVCICPASHTPLPFWWSAPPLTHTPIICAHPLPLPPPLLLLS